MNVIKELEKILKEKKINDPINLNTNLKDDLGLDSLDLMDLVVVVEEKLKIVIPDEKLSEIKTVKDFVTIINSVINDNNHIK